MRRLLFWDPSKCFLEDSHSGKLEDLMSETFHSSDNPEFRNHFSAETKTHQIVYESKYSPPNLTIFLEELGISSKLQYKDGLLLIWTILVTKIEKKGVRYLYLRGKSAMMSSKLLLVHQIKGLKLITSTKL